MRQQGVRIVCEKRGKRVTRKKQTKFFQWMGEATNQAPTKNRTREERL